MTAPATDVTDVALAGEAEELRLPGLSCPMPVLKAKKALAKLEPAARLRVWSTDPHSAPDLSDFCRQTGHRLLGQTEVDAEGRKWFVSLIAHRED